jgi:protein-tyrosine phosphatase
VVWAVSYEDDDPYGREQVPDFGLYLEERWATPPWDHEHLAWPDFGVPPDVDLLRASLADVLARAGAGARVELGCWGAHGRTGTALACLAVLAGHAPGDAVEWVRTNYCERAVETPEQQAFVESFTAG